MLATLCSFLLAAAASPAVSVFPIPGSVMATPHTQITFRGLPISDVRKISVTGSRTGPHKGHFEADSDSDGGSFLPYRSFKPGEKVTVRTGLNILGAQHGTYSFTVETPLGKILPPGQLARTPRVPGDVYSFHSAPGLHPAAVRIDEGSPVGPDIFLTPKRGPLQFGPEIVNGAGQLVWFDPVHGEKRVAQDLQVQRYHGQPVLTFWEGYLNAGVGKGDGVIMNNHYHVIATVKAGNGLQEDGHELTITPNNTALITAYRLVRWNAANVGARRQAAVEDAVLQEVDIPTGLVLFQWDSLDHVPLSDSYVRFDTNRHPVDYFHLNSIQELGNGNLLISARNTFAMYGLDHRTGRILWTLGGKASSFKMGPGAQTAYQHDARLQQGDLMTVFDDGGAPYVHPSRGLLERLNFRQHTAMVVRSLYHSPPLQTAFEGSTELLGGGKVFVSWGQLPFFSEYGPTGRQIFDGRFVDNNYSYRAFRFAWSGQPTTPPALAVGAAGQGATNVYASWNGATDVSAWRVLAGPNPKALVALTVAAKHGFETRIRVGGHAQYYEVQALGAAHNVLGTSAVNAG